MAILRRRELQHPDRDVEADGHVRRPRGAEQDVAGSAREIEDAVIMAERGQRHQAIFPFPIAAVREDGGNEVVAIRDRREHPANVALFPCGRGDG